MQERRADRRPAPQTLEIYSFEGRRPQRVPDHRPAMAVAHQVIAAAELLQPCHVGEQIVRSLDASAFAILPRPVEHFACTGHANVRRQPLLQPARRGTRRLPPGTPFIGSVGRVSAMHQNDEVGVGGGTMILEHGTSTGCSESGTGLPRLSAERAGNFRLLPGLVDQCTENILVVPSPPE